MPASPGGGAGARASSPALLSSDSTELQISLKSASTTPFRAINTKSQPCWTGVKRTASRILRFARLRVTALPIRLPTEKPALLTPRPFRFTLSTSSLSDHERFSARSAPKSLDFVRRRSLGIVRRTRSTLVHGQPVASFEHAALEHVASVIRRHSGAEAVHAEAPSYFRLESSLCHFVLTRPGARYCTHS